MNDVFQSDEDGMWYFWDETQSVLHGPYETFEYGQEARVRYAQHI
jgi:hypothetical protein